MTPTASESSLRRVVDIAVDNVAAGGGPFAALVIRGDEVVAEGVNRVTRDLDPTAHAEVVAIRAACRVIDDFTPDRVRPGRARASRARSAWPRRCGPGSTRSSTSPTATTRPAPASTTGPSTTCSTSPGRAGRRRCTRSRIAPAVAPFDAWLAKSDRISY